MEVKQAELNSICRYYSLEVNARGYSAEIMVQETYDANTDSTDYDVVNFEWKDNMGSEELEAQMREFVLDNLPEIIRDING